MGILPCHWASASASLCWARKQTRLNRREGWNAIGSLIGVCVCVCVPFAALWHTEPPWRQTVWWSTQLWQQCESTSSLSIWSTGDRCHCLDLKKQTSILTTLVYVFRHGFDAVGLVAAFAIPWIPSVCLSAHETKCPVVPLTCMLKHEMCGKNNFQAANHWHYVKVTKREKEDVDWMFVPTGPKCHIMSFKSTGQSQTVFPKDFKFSIVPHNIITSWGEQITVYLCHRPLADAPPALWTLPDDERRSGMKELRLTLPGQKMYEKQTQL